MTNIQAIDLLKDLEQCLDDYCELNDEGKTAFRMAIEALEVFGNSEQLPSAQRDHIAEVSKKVDSDLISRQAAIDAIAKYNMDMSLIDYPGMASEDIADYKKIAELILKDVPSAQPTLHGYNIEHLDLIARVLQKENLPPERIVEAITDIGRIVAIVRDEFEETLRRAVEQCTI